MVVPTTLIRARVEAPQIVEVSPRTKTVKIDVRTTLENISDVDYVVHAPDADQEIFWHVLDERHREILREQPRKKRRMKKGVEAFRGVTIAAGHGEHDTETLKIDGSKLKDGHTYTVRAEVFGQIAEGEFVAVVRMPLTPLTPAKKKVAKKKAVAKKSVAKRKAPAKKKATAKKAAGKKKAAKKK